MKHHSPVSPSLKHVELWLLASDILVLAALYAFAHYLRLQFWPDFLSVPFAVVLLALVLTLYIVDAYRIDVSGNRSRGPVIASFGSILSIFVSAVFVYFLGPLQFDSIFGRGVMPVALILFSGWAAWSRYTFSVWAEDKKIKSKWLFIGDAEKFNSVVRDFDVSAGELILLTSDDSEIPAQYKQCIRGDVNDIAMTDVTGITNVIIATDYNFSDADVSAFMDLRASGASVHGLTAFYEEYQSKVPVLHLKHGWFINSSGFYLLQDSTGLKIKRLLDLILSLFLLVIASPVMLVVAILIKLDSRGPVIYCQDRYGLNSSIFKVYKFRSMVADAERDGAVWAHEQDPRITRVGRFIRKSRIDEIPQLWNVLKGDMSFIGPRPERPEFIEQLEKEIPFYELRHLIKPGITGWAQVMYPYGSSVEDALQKLQYDLYYIKNYSVFLDFIILIKTLRIIIWHEGR